MPELPEVETVRRSLLPLLKGKKIKNVNIYYENVIEYPSSTEFISLIRGENINDIKRKGKWLIFELDNYYLLSHLRMEGKFFIKPVSSKVVLHEHIVFDLGDVSLRYHDTRKFGKMLLIKKDKINTIGPLVTLGPEPFDEMVNVKYLRNKFQSKKLPIKSTLLDQNIISGIGNIYANEILFLSRINPLRRSNSLSDDEIKSIIDNSIIVLEKAILKGGSTIKTYSSLNGVHGLFQNELNVHGKEKEPCPVCGSTILKITVGGRGTYYCPSCQKL